MAANHDQILKDHRDYYASNKPLFFAAARNRSALKRGTGEAMRLTAEQWESILDVFGHRCAYCLRIDRKLTQDHVLALSRGGLHTEDNVVPACMNCNLKKHANGVLSMLEAA